jgi:MFS family permease
MRQGPWTGRYPAAAAMVIFALVPYLALSAALEPITPIIAKDLHMSLQAMSLTSGMANAGYAVGTVLAVLLAQHLPQRRMLVLYAALLVLGSVLAAAAPDAGFFIAGHVLQGLCTSLLLIAAVPPLVVSFSLSKLRWTAMILNVCIFGAVALGPLVGGIQAQANGWRPLFWIIAGIAAAALVLSLLTFQDAPPPDRSATRNPLPVALAAAGCVALFYGASELLTHPFVDVMTLVPLGMWARADRGSPGVPVPRQASAAVHSPARQHAPGERDRGCDVRRGELYIRGRAGRRPSYRPVQSCASGPASVP